MLFVCYPKCSTCKKARKWLEENGIAFDERDIKEENPTRKELVKWHKQSGLPLRRFFNTSGMLYRDLQLKDKLPNMTEDEMYELLDSAAKDTPTRLIVLNERLMFNEPAGPIPLTTAQWLRLIIDDQLP